MWCVRVVVVAIVIVIAVVVAVVVDNYIIFVFM